MAKNLYLTFDVEDFINYSSILDLRTILELLEKTELKGLFFITGHMAEKLSAFEDILASLSNHEIGYHSTSHSVRPTIFEYTDIPDYEKAVEVALEKETSHIDPLTGETKGKGGITLVRHLFPNKKILAFRAPGLCWSPPHLEALHKVGIAFDFSTYLSKDSVFFKGTTFYPYPFLMVPPEGRKLNLWTYCQLGRRFLTRRTTVIDIHPQSLSSQTPWDSIFWTANPPKLSEVPKKSRKESRKIVLKFEKFLKWISKLQKTNTVNVTPSLKQAEKTFQPTRRLVEMSYKKSVYWPIHYFNYRPSYLYRHHLQFFELLPKDDESKARARLGNLNRCLPKVAEK